MVRTRVFRLILAASFAASCGGGGAGETTTPPPVQRLGAIQLSPSTVSLAAGTTTTLTVQAIDDKGAVITSATGFAFTTSAPAVAEVSVTGSVLAVRAGVATVTASLTYNGVTKGATSTVTVSGILPDRGAIAATADNAFSPNSVVISRGGQVTFTFLATHNVNFLEAGAPQNIPTITTTNTTIDRTFNSTGDFTFSCSLHGGMTGIIRVR